MHEKFSEKSIWVSAVFDDSEEESSRVQINFLKVYHEKKKRNERGYQVSLSAGDSGRRSHSPRRGTAQKVLKFCILMTSRGPNLGLSMT